MNFVPLLVGLGALGLTFVMGRQPAEAAEQRGYVPSVPDPVIPSPPVPMPIVPPAPPPAIPYDPMPSPIPGWPMLEAAPCPPGQMLVEHLEDFLREQEILQHGWMVAFEKRPPFCIPVNEFDAAMHRAIQPWEVRAGMIGGTGGWTDMFGGF